MSAPFYNKGPKDGLHVLKDKWCQKKHLQAQSEKLSENENLSQAIKATHNAAPSRRQGFRLSRGVSIKIDASERERIWERSLFIRWSAGEMSPVKGCWDRIVAFQVPLFAAQQRERWGYIDLLGAMADGTPSVIELKKDPKTGNTGVTGNSESPLRMILEAASYAIALRKNWPDFRSELIERLKTLGVAKRTVPPTLKTVKLVCAAPASYWIDWLPVSRKGRMVSYDTWRAFATLLDRFNDAYLPASFVSLSGDADRPESIAAQPLERFPLISE